MDAAVHAAINGVEKAKQYATARLTVVSNRVKRKFSASWSSHQGLTVLSHRLTKEFSSAPKPGDGASNLVFSPLSIYSALSVVAHGAQGSTLSELLEVLGAKSHDILDNNTRDIVERAVPEEGGPAGGPHLAYACGLWHDASRKLKPGYRDAAAASCRAVVRAVDFVKKPKEARNQINTWVAEATNNLISSILSEGSVDTETRLVITNAIYFKGKWETPFLQWMTRKSKFHRHDGSNVEAQFMSNRDAEQFIAAYEGFKVLKMPYKVRDDMLKGLQKAAVAAPLPKTITPPRYAMCVFLPDEHDGLPKLEDRMASSPGFVQDHLPQRRVEVGTFWVPKFKVSFSASVKQALQNLGIKRMFSVEGAELPEMMEDGAGSEPPLFVKDVLHRAVIEVDEEGTEAAACTVMAIKCGASLYQPVRVDFVADHPFAFFLVEEVSGAIIFAGHVHDPTES